MLADHSVQLFGIPVWIFQIGATFLGVIVGAVIAGIAAYIAYRNAYGSPPLIIVPEKMTIYPIDKSNEYIILITVDLWNNRKYPILPSQLIATLHGMQMKSAQYNRQNASAYHDEIEVRRKKNHAYVSNSGTTLRVLSDARIIKPQSYVTMDFEIYADLIEGEITEKYLEFKAEYHDPVAGKEKAVHQRVDLIDR